MNELFLITIFLFLYIVIQALLHHRQISQLQRLIKSETLQEFNDYTNTPQQPSPRRYRGKNHDNPVMEEMPNEISVDDPEFDLSKVTQVNVDGEEKPITIL